MTHPYLMFLFCSYLEPEWESTGMKGTMKGLPYFRFRQPVLPPLAEGVEKVGFWQDFDVRYW
jgi:hypothetical protein